MEHVTKHHGRASAGRTQDGKAALAAARTTDPASILNAEALECCPVEMAAVTADGITIFVNRAWRESDSCAQTAVPLSPGVPFLEVLSQAGAGGSAFHSLTETLRLAAAGNSSAARYSKHLPTEDGRLCRYGFTPLPGGQVLLTRERTAAGELEIDRESLTDGVLNDASARVKNSLNLLSTVLDLQCMECRESATRLVLERYSAYVKTLSATFDVLIAPNQFYTAPGLVSSKMLFYSLLPILRNQTRGKSLGFEIDEVPLTSRQAAALAFVTTAMAGDALETSGSHTEVEFWESHGQAVLIVEGDRRQRRPDDGGSSVHRELVEALATTDLRAEIRTEEKPDGCVRTSVTFPVCTGYLNGKVGNGKTQ